MGRETSDERHDRLRRAGRWLKQQREERALTQIELSDLLPGISQHAVSAYERGAYEIEPGVARDIARALKLTEYDTWKGLEIALPAEVDDPDRAIEWIAGRLSGRQMVALARRAAPELMARSPGPKPPTAPNKPPRAPRSGETSRHASPDEQSAI